MSKLDKDLEKLASEIRKAKAKASELSSIASSMLNGDMVYSPEEQELIYRVIKSVKPQMEDEQDRFLADSILSKSEWLGQGEK